jgi:hypothetical protein
MKVATILPFVGADGLVIIGSAPARDRCLPPYEPSPMSSAAPPTRDIVCVREATDDARYSKTMESMIS